MLTTVARLCVRTGRGTSVPFARFSLLPTVKCSTRSLYLNEQQYLSGPWLTRHLRLSARSLCLSSEPRIPPHPLPTPSDGDSQEHEAFGTLSADMGAKVYFRKSSPHIEDLRHQEWDEEDVEKPRRKPGRRNTPYWYHLQCKKLIKQNKVSRAAVVDFLILFCLILIS